MDFNKWKNRLFARSEDGGSGNSLGRALAMLALIVVLICLPLAFYFSNEPDYFSVIGEAGENRLADDGAPIVGVVTTTTLIKVADTLLQKPGGFLSNDVLPPMVLLDNIPNWEYGVLVQVRDMSRAMRDTFSRSQSQSTEDADLALAESRFNISHTSWVVPSAESEYRGGIKYLRAYLQRLMDEDKSDAQFYARADNLRRWLSVVDGRLGSMSQRLSASVGQTRLNTDLAGESAALQSTPAPSEIGVKTPWYELDDVFYEARGTCWALIHLLKAVEIDFAEVLERKNAVVSLRQIIRELEATQQSVYSPVILNGSGFGLLANHSLVMASYISRANAALIDMGELLSKG
jgi:hypothetical protein